MELLASYVRPSPTGDDRVRLIGDVRYGNGRSGAEKIWFDLPARFKDAISQNGNPWLVCLLPLAAQRGETLRLARPVDRQLMQNARRAMKIWRGWYPDMHEVDIEAELLPESSKQSGTHTGAFFSGGVDSFFTALECSKPGIGPKALKIDDLITVLGFDIPVTNGAAFDRLKRSLSQAGNGLGANLIDIATNLRTTRLSACSWPELLHGAALASVGLVFEPRFGKVLIAGTDDFGTATPWGSHPLVDPLFSTSNMAVVHHGAKVGRVEKLEAVARSGVALKALRVCWGSEADTNCGKCAKCYCTMLHLHLLGALDRCDAFDHKRFDFSRAERLYSRAPEVRIYLNAMKALALSREQTEIVDAIEKGIRRSDGWRYRPHHAVQIWTRRLTSGFPPSLRYHLDKVVHANTYRAE